MRKKHDLFGECGTKCHSNPFFHIWSPPSRIVFVCWVHLSVTYLLPVCYITLSPVCYFREPCLGTMSEKYKIFLLGLVGGNAEMTLACNSRPYTRCSEQ